MKMVAKRTKNGKNGKRTIDGYEIAVDLRTARKLKLMEEITGINETELTDIALNLFATHMRATSALCIDADEGGGAVEVRNHKRPKMVKFTLEIPHILHERFRCAAAWNDEAMEDYAVRILTDITEADENSAGVDRVGTDLANALKCYGDKALLPRAHFLRNPHRVMKCLKIGDFKPLES